MTKSQKTGGWQEVQGLLAAGNYLLNGDEALAEGALAAGCRFFSGYPITPATPIMEHMERRLKETKGVYTERGVFFQAEDELAAINNILGASWTGLKSMTATSGPGFSLMQEGISWADMTETPIVVVNVQRAGPSTGQATKTGTYDVREARWGSHGGVQHIALVPESAKECYALTIKAFNLAEIFRAPVIILSDATLANLKEIVNILPRILIFNRVFDPEKPFFGPTKDCSAPSFAPVGEGWRISILGATHDQYGERQESDPKIQEALIWHLKKKFSDKKEELIDVEEINIDECELLIFAYGSAARSAKYAQKMARKLGYKVGLLRPRILWPFPEEKIRYLPSSCRRIIVPETNQGQLIYVVQENASKRDVVSLAQPNGEPIDPRRILDFITRQKW